MAIMILIVFHGKPLDGDHDFNVFYELILKDFKEHEWSHG